MKLLIEDDEVEVKPIEIKSDDRGIVIPDRVGDRGEGKDDLTKAIIAQDVLELGASEAARIHGVPQSSASKYGSGKDISDEDTRAQILSKKHGIADVAITKLMESLDLFDPSDIKKPIDRVRAARELATIAQSMSPESKNGGQEVHLHLHAPRQRKMEDFQVIDVT